MAEIKIVENKEELQQYSDDDLYNINSWGADLSFREIINMYDDKELIKPELQRKYVWTRTEASRFIDSILLGLPVPSVFFAKEPNEKRLIIDGFQRIMTVYDYVKGVFSDDGKIFKLSNTENINVRWRGKAFAELEEEEKRRIRNTTIHAIIFEQKSPKNDTGMFQIFERINTGGRTLRPQEIRNCVYQGNFNTLLLELNKNEDWRYILQQEKEDSRMTDIELILRFFAMSEVLRRKEAKTTQINLSKYLNVFMSDKTGERDDIMLSMSDFFTNMIMTCKQLYGKNAFKNLKENSQKDFSYRISPTIFDAVSVATSFAIEKQAIDDSFDYAKNYITLLTNEEFIDATRNRTTNIEKIKTRISLATKILYGIDYEA